ncbi:MAG TPA: hydrogenase maturation protease [Pirellulales bacterium]|nr:hydrogenase maturation protease [Pirellulales bacterium]
MSSRILVAGIGNIFLGDDAFGVETVKLLAGRALPPGVQAVDFGVRGLDLTYALLEDWQAVILIDAAPCGGAPGALYVIEPELDEASEPASLPLDAHAMQPDRVLRLVASLGGRVRHLLVVGCEPSPLEGYDIQSGLSPPVAAAVNEAADLVESLLAKLLMSPCDSAPR